MNKTYKPSVFSQMNKANMSSSSSQIHKPNDYKAWKQKEKGIDTPLNPTSATDFPDLVKETTKKTVFQGISLANRLKETIAAEEEAAIQRRLKKGDTPETLLREQCVSLPLKGHKASVQILEVPEWVTDTSKPIILPSFKPKSMAQILEERRWRRLGINPNDLNLYDDPVSDIEDDRISVPSLPERYEEFQVEEEEQSIPPE